MEGVKIEIVKFRLGEKRNDINKKSLLQETAAYLARSMKRWTIIELFDDSYDVQKKIIYIASLYHDFQI